MDFLVYIIPMLPGFILMLAALIYLFYPYKDVQKVLLCLTAIVVSLLYLNDRRVAEKDNFRFELMAKRLDQIEDGVHDNEMGLNRIEIQLSGVDTDVSNIKSRQLESLIEKASETGCRY